MCGLSLVESFSVFEGSNKSLVPVSEELLKLPSSSAEI